jgi:hypothetical protein
MAVTWTARPTPPIAKSARPVPPLATPPTLGAGLAGDAAKGLENGWGLGN